MNFVDWIQIKLLAGHGGKGSVHFQRTRRAPRAGPDGGDGGNGGDIILYPKNSLSDFSHLIQHTLYKAESGKPGEKSRQKGAKGEDLILYVPEGTSCYDSKGVLLKKLRTQAWCFLKGGRGGKGNHFFKNSRTQAPQSAQPGEATIQKKIILELKWESDVCLIGFRSSGKTSFLLNLSQKNEKLYPSSVPRLLSIKQADSTSILFLDLPGLTPSNKKFLKQAEKTKVILFFISLTDFDPFASYQKLRQELEIYDQEHQSHLLKKPCLLLLTGKKTEISIKQVELFKNETIKQFPFFTTEDKQQNKKLINQIIKMYKG